MVCCSIDWSPRISHTCTLATALTATATIVAASCGWRFLEVLLVRTFPFFRHLRLPIRVDGHPPMDRYLPITRDAFNRLDIRHKQQSAGGEKRNTNKSQSHSFRSLLCVSSFSACWVRKVTMWWPAELLETQRRMEPGRGSWFPPLSDK